MRRRTLLAGLAATPFGARAAEPPVTVVASFSILADLCRAVGGEDVSVVSLIAPDRDAHGFEPRPSDLLAVRAARVVVTNGLGLDPWMDRLAASAGGEAMRVTASRDITPRRLGDALDPHAWQDPENGVRYATAIAEGLASAAPARAARFRARATAYTDQIREAGAWIEATLAPLAPEKRKIITSHDAFGYYGARYAITFLAAQGIATDAEPSARDIARLAQQIRRERIHAVFLENMTDPRIAQALAREAGAVLGGTVYSDALSAPGGPAETYLALLRYNTTLFAAAMAQN